MLLVSNGIAHGLRRILDCFNFPINRIQHISIEEIDCTTIKIHIFLTVSILLLSGRLIWILDTPLIT